MKKKIAEKSYSSLTDRMSKENRGSQLKHLSDTEDSLILSEKKLVRSSFVQSQNGAKENFKTTPSIVDVKIKAVLTDQGSKTSSDELL